MTRRVLVLAAVGVMVNVFLLLNILCQPNFFRMFTWSWPSVDSGSSGNGGVVVVDAVVVVGETG